MSLTSLPAMRAAYGCDFLSLIGGGLFSQGNDLVENCRAFRRMAEEFGEKE